MDVPHSGDATCLLQDQDILTDYAAPGTVVAELCDTLR